MLFSAGTFRRRWRHAAFFGLLIVSAAAHAFTLDDLAGHWHGAGGGVIDVRGADGYLIEPTPQQSQDGFRRGERVVHDIRVSNDSVRFQMIYRAAGCPASAVEFRGTIAQGGREIAGENKLGYFEARGTEHCRYVPTQRFKALEEPYRRVLDAGPLKFVTRFVDANGHATFEEADAITFGQRFGVQVKFDPPRTDVHDVTIDTPQGAIHVPLRPVPGEPGLLRSPPITVLPLAPAARIDGLLPPDPPTHLRAVPSPPSHSTTTPGALTNPTARPGGTGR